MTTMTNRDSYTIQEMSRRIGLPSSTLRYYEDIGLLEPVERAANGHRRYSQTDLGRLTLIKNLRLTGMSIEAMCDFVALYRGGRATARQRRELLQAHRRRVQAHVDEMLEMIGFIDMKIGMYQEEEIEHERESESNYEISAVGPNGTAGL